VYLYRGEGEVGVAAWPEVREGADRSLSTGWSAFATWIRPVIAVALSSIRRQSGTFS
jgi:hypothetical protein